MPKKGPVEMIFYVNPETNEVDAIFSFTVLGITERVDSDWEDVTREDSGLYGEYATHHGYVYDWDTEPLTIDENFDFDDYDLVTPTPVKMFDKDELSLEELKKYASLEIKPISKEEMEEQIRAHQKLYGDE